MNKSKEPKPEDYGWQEGSYDQEAGWMLEDGEEMYNEAMAEYKKEKSNEHKK
jgi:hypothetical protein